jgi:hypothetical protein
MMLCRSVQHDAAHAFERFAIECSCRLQICEKKNNAQDENNMVSGEMRERTVNSVAISARDTRPSTQHLR